MTRRRQITDAVGLVVLLAVLIVLISLFFPAVRRALAEPGIVTLGAEILVTVSLVGWGIYRLAVREGWIKAMGENPFAPASADSDQTWNDDESEVIPDILYPMLRRRYPWRH
jgi:hypothetical protein